MFTSMFPVIMEQCFYDTTLTPKYTLPLFTYKKKIINPKSKLNLHSSEDQLVGFKNSIRRMERPHHFTPNSVRLEFFILRRIHTIRPEPFHYHCSRPFLHHRPPPRLRLRLRRLRSGRRSGEDVGAKWVVACGECEKVLRGGEGCGGAGGLRF